MIGTTLEVTGWGKTNATEKPDKLRQASVWIVPVETPNIFGCYYNTHFDRKKQICAGLPAYAHHGRRGTCLGDGGGPLVKKNTHNNKWFQYGVISGGPHPCGEDNLKAGKLYKQHFLPIAVAFTEGSWLIITIW